MGIGLAFFPLTDDRLILNVHLNRKQIAFWMHNRVIHTKFSGTRPLLVRQGKFLS